MLMEETDTKKINLSIMSPNSSKFDSSSPMTPGQRLRYLLSSPSRYMQKKFQAGGLKGSIMTILASTVGAGILSLPYAINLAGLYEGIVIFILGMIVSLYTCQLLVLSAEKTGKLTYESIGNELFGPRMRVFAEINMIVNNYGTVIAYIVLLKDLIPNSLHLFGVKSAILENSYMWGTLITMGIVYPLSLMKQISALRYTSLLSFLSCVYLAIAVIIGFFTMRSDPGERFAHAPAAEFSAYSFFTSTGFVVFSFTCHPNVVAIYQELQRRDAKRGFKFLSRGLFMALILYLIVGVFGFLTFYKEYSMTSFPGQILQAKYHKGNIPIIIVCFI